MGELTGTLNRILADYESRGRDPRMVLAVLSGLTHEMEQEWGALPAPLGEVGQVVHGWEEGRREDRDALTLIAGLVRHA